jgi:glycosidase
MSFTAAAAISPPTTARLISIEPGAQGMHNAAEPRSVRPASQPGRRLLLLIPICLASTVPLLTPPPAALAQDTSRPATLQLFEARWQTMEQRMIDVFYAGYGAMWVPPPSRADSGDQSVGYDVYDRFDLGGPNRSTLYGTKTGLKTAIGQAHNAGVNVYTDLVLNHNGFSDLTTVDTKGTATTTDDVTFLDAGGYPGFALSLPGDPNGDFHPATATGDIQGRLSGLIDIAQEKNYQFIRHPVDPLDPNNIPAGTASAFGRLANIPTPSNAQFYTDQGLGGTAVSDPKLGTTPTLYDFNTANPLAGDPVMENATGLLMRNVRWMVQEVGVDGFRIDAAKHFEPWVLDFIDQALFQSIKTPLLDGSRKDTFMFSEVIGSTGQIQSYIRKDINPATPNTVGGNRDALDFPLFFAMQGNLTGVGPGNNWHAIRNASQDLQDDGLRNGSQGVSFVNSHDDLAGGTPFLEDVAYAYTLLRPGDAIVYHNAKEFGNGRAFPKDGRDDALGGFNSDTLTTLLDIRNTHGRGDFQERWIDDAFNPNGFSNIYIYERENSAVVALNSGTANGEDTRNGVQTSFAPGTRLVELTGNADDLSIDPNDDVPNVLIVNAAGQINVTIPRNRSDNGNLHGKGYVIYGLANPQGAVSIPDAGATLTGAGPAATAATAVIGDVDVINNDTFTVRLDTNAVTLPDGFRDLNADGDFAALKIDQGIDVNGNGGVDFTAPGSTTYGFENFTTLNSPGFGSPTGDGAYEQTVDATQLAEGYRFITTRAFRRRTDGGPAIYSDFKRVVYIDRLPPDSAVDSLELNGTGTGNMDLLMRSVDQTAQAVFVYLDLPANATEAEILDIDPASNTTLKIDRDLFKRSFLNVKDGIHVVTLLTVESTGTFNIQRFAGFSTTGGNGAGLGDLDADDVFSPDDLTLVPGGFQDILYSQNDKFNAAADANADGLVDNRDLFLLGGILTNAGADQPTLDAYAQVLLDRGDLNADSFTNAADIDLLFTQFGSTAWLVDLDVSGITDNADVDTLIQTILRTDYGDLDLDGAVSYNDRNTLQANLGLTGLGWAGGDLDGSGLVDQTDLDILLANFLQGDLDGDGFVGIGDLNIVLGAWNQSVTPGDPLAGDPSGDGFVGIDDLNAVLGDWNAGTPPPAQASDTVPEPATFLLLTVSGCALLARRGTLRP